jgi:hypothetical protein
VKGFLAAHDEIGKVIFVCFGKDIEMVYKATLDSQEIEAQ